MNMLGEALRSRASDAAEVLRLPLRHRTWRGLQGNWQGIGTGSSIDFQDHRPYVPGDDPRYINWQAFARTGHYTMKLYRQEVSPAFDLLVDVSPSMFCDRAKAERTKELAWFCLESGRQSGASIRTFRLNGTEIELISPERLFDDSWLEPGNQPADVGGLRDTAWRHGSMRIFISDLLWPDQTQPVADALTSQNGFGIIFSPFSVAEAEPDWNGNLELIDCENRVRRLQRIDASVLAHYRDAYTRHFALWEEQAIRSSLLLARVPAGASLVEALSTRALQVGAVEWAS